MKYMILTRHKFKSNRTGRMMWFSWKALQPTVAETLPYASAFMKALSDAMNSWGDPKTAKRFNSQEEAEAFMKSKGMVTNETHQYKLQKCH